MNQDPVMVSDNFLSCFPYGVGHGTDGVCLLIQMGNHRVLLDCGLADIQPLEANCLENHPPADVVLVSHAHGDHAQGLLALHQSFPELPIYASDVTVKLLPLNWIEEAPVPQFCHGLKWRSPLKVGDNLSIELFPAGHLPGAAAILLTYKSPQKTYKVFYTGDFCLSNLQLVEGLSIDALRGLAPDVLIVEGSYGTARHSHRRQQEKQLMERIAEALAGDMSVLLPVPSLGLGQEILKLLRSHHQFTGRNLDIWVDGTVALACDLYLELLSQFPASVQNFAKHQPLFWDERVCPRMRRLTPVAKQSLGEAPVILIVDDKADLKDYCSGKAWLILVPEHPGVSLTAEAGQMWIKQEDSKQLKLESYLLAEHSDIRNTTQLIHNLRPQHLVFVHGSPSYLADITSLEELQNRYQLHSPAPGTLVELPIGDKFIQPVTPPQSSYEGELNEFASFITVTLPDAITSDPRWNNFADTGIVEARWQGEELLLRGISQRELLSQTNDARRRVDFDCCSNCWYYRTQRCWNQASPLYGFKVTPEGYCPVFEPFTSEE